MSTEDARSRRPVAYPPGQRFMKNRLRVLRAELEWSQADLAERLQVSRQTVNAIENRRYGPRLDFAFQMAKLFRRPIEAIFHPDAESAPD
jgi:putative transcriptional regulator